MSAAAAARRSAPDWLYSLLYTAAQRLAMLGVQACEFQARSGPDEAATYRASLQLDPQTAAATVYVHHAASGVCVCRSVPVIVDSLDETAWDTDISDWLCVANPKKGKKGGAS
jgi:hypothetical protein